MNLAICLLMARRFIEKSQIRQVVEGYHDLSDAAFERTFERDKDELRVMGVPVETGSNNPLFPDEVGYRIRRKDFELPAIEFDSAETAALGLAATVWESATQAEQAVSALAKLRAAGVDPDPARLSGLAPVDRCPRAGLRQHLGGDRRPHPDPVQLQGPASGVVEPWAMTYRRGAWYLLGPGPGPAGPPHVQGGPGGRARPSRVGKPGSYRVPDLDLDAAWRRLEPRQADTEAIVAIRPGRAAELVRRGRRVEHQGSVPAGYDVYAVGYARVGDLVGELCAHGADAVVLAPQRIRRAVIAELKAVAGSRGMTSAEQVARLLALVPYLQSHPDAELGTDGRRLRRLHRAAARGPERALVLRPARRHAGRPDRDRHGHGCRVRPDPAQQRRVPCPPDALHPRRGDEPRGGPARGAGTRRSARR